MDHIFSQLIPHVIGVLIWRQMWNILDDTFIVGDQLTTCAVSLGSGFGVLLLCIIISEPVFANVSARLGKFSIVLINYKTARLIPFLIGKMSF